MEFNTQMVELIADGDNVLGALIECNGQRQRVRGERRDLGLGRV